MGEVLFEFGSRVMGQTIQAVMILGSMIIIIFVTKDYEETGHRCINLL